MIAINRKWLFHTFLVAIVFWYTGGAIRAIGSGVENGVYITILIALFVYTFIVSYFIYFKRAQRYITHRIRYIHINSYRVQYIVLGMLVLILTTYIGREYGGMIAYHSGRLPSVVGILSIALVFCGERKYRYIFVSFYIYSLLDSIEIYSRRPFMVLVAALGVMILSKRRMGKTAIIRLTIGVIISFLALTYITGLRAANAGIDPLSLTRIFDIGTEQLLGGRGFDTIYLLDYIIKTYPDSVDYLYGGSLFGALVNPIPRSIWPDKPIAFGIQLAAHFFGVAAGDVPSNFGPGIVAESYANGGFIALLITALGFGLLLAWLDIRLSVRSTDPLSAAMLIILITGLFFMIRGDFLNAFYEIYIKAIPVFAVMAFSRHRHSLQYVYIKTPVAPNANRTRFND